MSRQIDQEIIQATDELKKDVALTTDIITGDENTVVEVAPGNDVRSPKKMIEDCYQETQQAIEQKFGSLDQAVKDAADEADRAEVASQSSSDSAGNSADSASASAASASAAQNSATTATQKATESADSATLSEDSVIAAKASELASASSATQAGTSASNSASSASAASQSATQSGNSATASDASADAAAAEATKAQQSATTATTQADRAESEADRSESEADRAEAAGADSLKKASNLSDLANKTTSRTNLDVYSIAEMNTIISNLDALPDQSGHGGQLLGTDGAVADWVEPPVALPYQTGHDGKYLQTNGTIATWQPAAISNPNLLINGDFSVWQRGINFTGNGYTVDRWISSNLNISKGSLGNLVDLGMGEVSYLKALVKTTNAPIGQLIELDTAMQLSARTVTLSFYALGKGAAEGKQITSEYSYNDSTDHWISTGRHTLSSTWKRFFTTYTFPNFNNLKKLTPVQFQLSGANGGEVFFANVKLELGSTATPFIPDDPATNLAKCQRYYWQMNILAGAMNPLVSVTADIGTKESWCYLDLPTEMRAIPTIGGTARWKPLAPAAIGAVSNSRIAIYHPTARFYLDGSVATSFSADAEL